MNEANQDAGNDRSRGRDRADGPEGPGAQGGPDAGRAGGPDLAAARARAAESVQRRYLVDSGRYMSRATGNPVAFEERGGRLRTVSDEPAVAQSMMRLAFSQGWESVGLRGSAAFRREAWLEANALGLPTRGYEPSPADRAQLREVVQEMARQNRPSAQLRGAARQTARDGESVPEDRASRDDSHLLDVLKVQMRARGDGEQAIARAEVMARRALQRERSVGGTIVEYGHAPYAFDGANNPSFYVRLNTGRGERTVWGLGLESAVNESQLKRGDLTVLRNEGQEGESTRNRWTALALTRMAEDERDAVLKRANRTPQVRMYDPLAPRPERPTPALAPQRPRDVQRERG